MIALAAVSVVRAQAGQSPDPSFVFVPPSGGGADDRFGASIAFHEDKVLVGSPQRPFTLDGVTHNAQGSAAVYRRGGDGYILETNLVVLLGHANDFTGTAVDMVSDMVVAGAPGVDIIVEALPLPNQLQAGGVFAWRWESGSWGSPVFLAHPNPRSNDLFGAALSVQREVFGDGTSRHTLAIGAATDDIPIPTGGSRIDSGSVTIWEFEAGVWTLKANIEMPVLLGETALSTAGALFGTSVRMEGKYLLVGAKRASPVTASQGAVYVFRRSSEADPAPVTLASDPVWGEWTLTQRIVAVAPESYDQFGTSIDAQQGRLIIGAPNRKVASMPNAGAAYIYARDLLSEQYEWEASLVASDAQSGDLFGASAGIWSDRAAVGAPGVDVGSGTSQVPSRGSVYIYSTDAATCATWTQNTEYAPPSTASTPDASFGTAIRVGVAEILISAPRAPGPSGPQQGAAFSYPIDTIGCAWDLTGDGVVDGLDLAKFFSHWGGTAPDDFVADYDGNLVVDGLDMSYCIGHWGPCQCGDAQPPP